MLDQRKGMFKGPYVQIRLPFEQFTDEKALRKCLEVRPSFYPYKHQYEAFQRLSTRNGHTPEPVILTTGTGSGKTESFLFPLLDYCYQHRERPGIKAVILYPMNALATDQARRLAEEIHGFRDENGEYVLRDRVRAGLFIGEGRQKGKNRATRMGADHIIEDRDTLIKAPPDILLTNFKMLDFSLMQARFHNLWKYNLVDPELLRFLVLDELHTYDGAKGSDVANLIRRLKLKLKLPKDQLVPVGTSATMAGGEEGKTELVHFFSQVFGVPVDSKAVIEEDRQPPYEFFDEELQTPQIDLTQVSACRFLESDTYESYLDRQRSFWGYDGLEAVGVGEALRKNRWLWELLERTGSEVQEIRPLARQWSERIGLPPSFEEEQRQLLLASLLSLVSYSKRPSGTKHFPFLYVQLTYWLRSLSRILLKVQPAPVFTWESEWSAADTVLSLPPYQCRECGGCGWVALKKEHSDHLETDLTRTRQLFISDRQNKNIYFLSSLHERRPEEVFAADYVPTGDPIDGYLDPQSLYIHDRNDAEGLFRVFGVRRQVGNQIEKVCPHCNARNTLALIGTGLPTLESIAAAQILATTTDNARDRERKLLAFTNGVQDAAHQAGFIENRNYRFGMRHAIQGVARDLEEPVSMTEFYRAFEKHWKQHIDAEEGDKLDAYYYKFLPPDCESRINMEDFRNKDGSFRASFEKEFSNRMAWEIWSEFSYNAAIGRTLEKSGASGIAFDQDLMERIYDQLVYWLDQNTLGNRVPKDDFLKFLNGFLHRLRLRGGVDHPYLFTYRTGKSNYWLITQGANKRHFLMKNFGKRTRLPRFLTLRKGKFTDVYDVLQVSSNQNWFSTYFLKSFQLVGTQETELINDFYDKLVEYLDSNRLLDKKVAAGTVNYGIAADQLRITGNIQGFACQTCDHQLYVGTENSNLTTKMPCLKYHCRGRYEPLRETTFDYYRMVYNRGKALRIFAHDHTGLIDRNKREELERAFKTRPTFQSPNVLVATSTLEMGIDIGDLNVTFNAGLPPETANYLQRVGRAGRSSGTSLILNLAGRDEHDLYYFQEPMKMMAGQIRTPACYLEARDILKRHFMAFCFDCWAGADPENHRIPYLVKQLRVKSLPPGDERFVFNQIAGYSAERKKELFELFLEQYQEDLPEDSVSVAELRQELNSGAFFRRLIQIHTDLLAEIKYYEDKRREVDRQLKKLPATGYETEILKNEKRALSGAIFNIYRRNTIEYLTNIGVLPNYAFPETGVLLNAQVRRKKEVDGQVEYKYDDFGEIVRPSSSAITELAPANIFYSQGHKLEAQGLEILSRDEFEEYRFCSNCAEMAREVDVPEKQINCPTCGHNSWSSVTNKKMLVRLRSVLSVNDQEKSKITDSSDDRERMFYQRSVHIRTDQQHSRGAFVLKRVPFGMEFFSRAGYVDINTGIREEGFFASRTIEINGVKYPEVGFVVCKKCGKTTERPLTKDELDNKKRTYHFGYCSNRDQIYQGRADDFFEEIYIYRQFYTEALKILLPVQDFRTEEQVAVFKAGLFLGLKDYYKGHPDHVNIKEYVEYNKEKKRKERYLVLYETIPGGTGYLSKLFDTEEFTRLLQIAYERIALCTCKDEGKDGCYQCIYTYGNQFEREVLSRQEAEALFKDIIDKSNEWNKVDSLKGIDGFANVEESVLEQRLVELLRVTAGKRPGWAFREEIEQGIKVYQLTVAAGPKSVTYRIWPQNLQSRLYIKGVETQPDFVFKCISIQNGREDAGWLEVEQVKDIIVYTDGHAFHATQEHPRAPKDIQIRNTLIESERYHFWILTHEDLEHARENTTDHLAGLMQHNQIKNYLFAKHPLYRAYAGMDLLLTNSFSRFLYLLSAPLLDLDLRRWAALLLFACNKELLGKCYPESVVREEFLTRRQVDESKAEKKNPAFFVQADALHFSAEMGVQVFVHPQQFDVLGYAYFDEKLSHWDKDNWQRFWEVFNLTQFFGIRCLSAEEIVELQQLDPSDEWQEVLENFDPALHSIVRELVQAGISINTHYDFDIFEEGEVVAVSRLGSHERKFAVWPYDDQRSEAEFTKRGYKVFSVENFDIRKI